MKSSTAIFLIAFACFLSNNLARAEDAIIDAEEEDIQARISVSCIKDTIGKVAATLKDSAQRLKDCTADATAAGQEIYQEVTNIETKVDEFNKLREDWDKCSGFKCTPVVFNMISVAGDIAASLGKIIEKTDLIAGELDPKIVTCIRENSDIMGNAIREFQKCV